MKIVGSSGFDPAKCKVMAESLAPVDVIGTGSFLPQRWTETYATADIIEYDGVKRVKVGREFLFRKIDGPSLGLGAASSEILEKFWSTR